MMDKKTIISIKTTTVALVTERAATQRNFSAI